MFSDIEGAYPGPTPGVSPMLLLYPQVLMATVQVLQAAPGQRARQTLGHISCLHTNTNVTWAAVLTALVRCPLDLRYDKHRLSA